MHRVVYKHFFISICMMVLCGCEFSKTSNSDIDDQIIKIAVSENTDSTSNSVLTGEIIHFAVINTSEESIWFPPDFNVELFAKTNGQWASVKNKLEYGAFDHLLGPSSSMSFSAILLVAPDLPPDSMQTEMQMKITGFIMEDGTATNESVSAEIDFVLSP